MQEVFKVMFSHCRLVTNLAVEQQQYYSVLHKPPTATQRSRQLTELKQEYPWLADTPAVVLQQALKDFDQGMANFFEGRANKPVFKSYSKGDNSFRVVGAGSIKIKKLSRTKYEVRIPKLGWCKATLPRELPVKKVTSYTVTMSRSGRYHVSFTTTKPINTKKTKSTDPHSIVGIDLGCVNTITLSTGEVFNFSRPDLDEKIHQAQVAYSHTKKGSNRREAARIKLARAHEKKKNARLYFAHQVSTHVARKYGNILLEGLPTADMTASAAGTLDDPGTNVAAKAGLNRSILDNGWGIITTLLGYKAPGRVWTVPYRFSSQKCSQCGHVDKINRQTQALFVCVQCGFDCNADLNAATNLRNTPQDLWKLLGSGPKRSTKGPRKKKRRKKRLEAKKLQEAKQNVLLGADVGAASTTAPTTTPATQGSTCSAAVAPPTTCPSDGHVVESSNKACSVTTPDGVRVTSPHSASRGS